MTTNHRPPYPGEPITNNTVRHIGRRSPSSDGRSVDTSSSTTTPEANCSTVIPTSPQQTEIVRQLLEFMCATEEGDPEATSLFAGLSAHRQLFNAAAECDEMLLEGSNDGGWLGTGGTPISVCVEGNGYYFQLSEDDLRKVFRRYGEVSIIEVIGPEKDVAHVYYKQLTDAQNAVQDLNDKMLNGVRGVLRVVWGLHQSPRTFPARTSPKTLAQNDNINLKEELVAFGPLSEATHWTAETLEKAEAGISRLLSEIKDAASPMKMTSSKIRGSTRPSELPQSQPPSSGPHRNNAWRRSQSPKDKGRAEERAVWSEEGAAPQQLSRSPPKTSSPRGGGGSGGPIRKFTCRFDIGIDNDKEFQVARRIIGNKGANMKRIVNLSNAKLRLRGQGSGYLEGAVRQESPDPLHLCISCVGRDGYLAAVEETKALLNKVYNEYRNYEINKGNDDPGIIKIQMKEHFLTGPGERDIDMDYAQPASSTITKDSATQPSYPSSYTLPSSVFSAPTREGPYNYPR